jgi:hypothetical protein
MDTKKIEKLAEKYEIGGINLFAIRNRNEVRAVETMARILAQEYPDFHPEALDYEDIYALALNKLPARYVQRGSIVLGEPVSEIDVADAVRSAIEAVRKNPSYTKG